MRLSDYSNAVRLAAQEVGFLRSASSVILARFFWGIGPLYHSLFRLFRVPMREWSSYINSSESNKLTDAINGKENYYLARDKLGFYQHCVEQSIPTVPILGVIGACTAHNLARIGSSTEFKEFLQSCPRHVFFKISDGSHGDGAVSARFLDNKWIVKRASYSPEGLYKMLLENLPAGSAYLVQPAVQPIKLLRSLMPNDALGTVRIVTYLQGEKATPILPLLRIPANENVTDNFSLGLSGNLVVSVDIDSGILGVAKGSQCVTWPAIVDLFDHPDTLQRIEGRTLPYWNETLDLVVKAQEKTPQLPTLGWDVAITDDGPLIVEANTAYATEIHEVAYERGIRPDLMPIAALMG